MPRRGGLCQRWPCKPRETPSFARLHGTRPQRARCSRTGLDAGIAVTTIEKGSSVLTLINVFSVDPSKQDELVELLVEATQQTMKHLPGFISANIHRSLDASAS